MIIFGLGNPGVRYRSTRHSVGYMFVSRLARLQKKRFFLRHSYKIAKIKINRKTIYLIKPSCWMNQSGIVVAQVLHEIVQDFLIVLDDINLPLGKIRMRSRGCDGGHLGLRSIINALNSSDFPRLRIGVGFSNDVTSYVLNSFKSKEKKILKSVIEHGIEGIEIMLKQSFAKAQNYINAIDLTVKFEARNPKP